MQQSVPGASGARAECASTPQSPPGERPAPPPSPRFCGSADGRRVSPARRTPRRGRLPRAGEWATEEGAAAGSAAGRAGRPAGLSPRQCGSAWGEDGRLRGARGCGVRGGAWGCAGLRGARGCAGLRANPQDTTAARILTHLWNGLESCPNQGTKIHHHAEAPLEGGKGSLLSLSFSSLQTVLHCLLPVTGESCVVSKKVKIGCGEPSGLVSRAVCSVWRFQKLRPHSLWYLQRI